MEIRERFNKERFVGWVGGKIKGLTMLIDVVDACPMRCPTCPTGTQESRNGHRMTIDTFKRLLDKAQSECKLRKVQLYRWSDPLLHPQIHLFAEECIKRGIRCSTSSVLQHTNCDFEKLIESRVTEFRVSFSGWKHMTYYQKNATPERFLKKLDTICKLPRYPETTWEMFFHQYKDNLDETKLAEKIAKDYNLKFSAFPATYMMYERIIDGYIPEDEPILSRLLERPEDNIARFTKKPKSTDYCIRQEKEITLDSHGRMQLCQLMYLPEYIMGDFLNTPLKEIREKIMAHPMCKKCKACGVGRYSEIFADPAVEPEPVIKADKGKYVDGKSFPDQDEHSNL